MVRAMVPKLEPVWVLTTIGSRVNSQEVRRSLAQRLYWRKRVMRGFKFLPGLTSIVVYLAIDYMQ